MLRYVNQRLNGIIADKSHLVIVALRSSEMSLPLTAFTLN